MCETHENEQSTIRKSRIICLIGAVIIYALYLGWFLGDGYFWFFFLPVATVIFLPFCVALFIPACYCVRRFLNKQESAFKRRVFLLLVLVPYLACASYFSYHIVDNHVLSTSQFFIWQQQQRFEKYSTLYYENAEGLNTINNDVIGRPVDHDMIINGIWISPESEIIVLLEDKSGESQNQTLETVDLPQQNKDDIRKLMQNMTKHCNNIVIWKNQLVFKFKHYNDTREVRFVKDSSGDDEPRIFIDAQQPLGDGWMFGVYTWDSEKGD